MAALFFTNFASDIREAMEANGFCIPQRPPRETRDVVYQRIAQVKNEAVRAERGVNANLRAFMQVHGNRHGSSDHAAGYLGQINDGYEEAPVVYGFMGSAGRWRQDSHWPDEATINAI
eukprot:5400142-Ditylum_brightwellii.AAC.1